MSWELSEVAWESRKGKKKKKRAFRDCSERGERKKILRAAESQIKKTDFQGDLQKVCCMRKMKSPSPHKNPSPIILSCILDGAFKTFYSLHCVFWERARAVLGPCLNSVSLCGISNKWSLKGWHNHILRWVIALVLLLMRKDWSSEESGSQPWWLTGSGTKGQPGVKTKPERAKQRPPTWIPSPVVTGLMSCLTSHIAGRFNSGPVVQSLDTQEFRPNKCLLDE